MPPDTPPTSNTPNEGDARARLEKRRRLYTRTRPRGPEQGSFSVDGESKSANISSEANLPEGLSRNPSNAAEHETADLSPHGTEKDSLLSETKQEISTDKNLEKVKEMSSKTEIPLQKQDNDNNNEIKDSLLLDTIQQNQETHKYEDSLLRDTPGITEDKDKNNNKDDNKGNSPSCNYLSIDPSDMFSLKSDGTTYFDDKIDKMFEEVREQVAGNFSNKKDNSNQKENTGTANPSNFQNDSINPYDSLLNGVESFNGDINNKQTGNIGETSPLNSEKILSNDSKKDKFKDISVNDTLMNQVNQLTEYLNNPDIGFGKRRNSKSREISEKSPLSQENVQNKSIPSLSNNKDNNDNFNIKETTDYISTDNNNTVNSNRDISNEPKNIKTKGIEIEKNLEYLGDNENDSCSYSYTFVEEEEEGEEEEASETIYDKPKDSPVSKLDNEKMNYNNIKDPKQPENNQKAKLEPSCHIDYSLCKQDSSIVDSLLTKGKVESVLNYPLNTGRYGMRKDEQEYNPDARNTNLYPGFS